MPGLGAMENGHEAMEVVKKSKKVKGAEAEAMEVSVSPASSPAPPDSEKKKKKKEKKIEAEVGVSATTVNGHVEEEEAAPKSSKKKRAKSPEENGAVKKIQKVVESGGKEAGAVVEAPNPMSVSNFNISKVLRDKLKSKGIEALFPIQAQTFDAVFSGNDLVGRARTGQVGFCTMPQLEICMCKHVLVVFCIVSICIGSIKIRTRKGSG